MKYIVIIFLVAIVATSVKSQVSTGDIAFIGYNEDSPVDGFTIITLNSIPGSSTIYFTDQGVNSSTSWNANGEDHWRFTAPVVGIPCGTIVSFTENTTDVLTITGVSGASMVHLSGAGLFNLSGGDQMLAYTVSVPGVPASLSSAVFIAGITSDDGNGTPTCLDVTTGWSSEGGCIGTSVNRSMLPPGLTNGVNCLSLYPAIGTELDNSKYNGTLTGTSTDLRAAINNRSNWVGDDVTNYDISPSGFASPSVVCVILPIEIIEFMVEKDVNNHVNVSWSTASEENNDYFEIQNSVDGAQWQLVGAVPGKGNSTTIQNYTFMDQKPMRGTSYYRLKQVDFDGEMSYTPIKPISFDVDKSFRLFPNPATHQLSIYGEYPEDALMQIFNVQGCKMEGLLFNKEGSGISVDVSNFPPGLYLLHLHGESLRFIKAVR